jgi:hypothetical protein
VTVGGALTVVCVVEILLLSAVDVVPCDVAILTKKENTEINEEQKDILLVFKHTQGCQVNYYVCFFF